MRHELKLSIPRAGVVLCWNCELGSADRGCEQGCRVVAVALHDSVTADEAKSMG
jgi:hypothetical protein